MTAKPVARGCRRSSRQAQGALPNRGRTLQDVSAPRPAAVAIGGCPGGGDHASAFPGTLQRWKVVEHQTAKPTELPDAKFSSEKPICMGILMGASDRFAFAETGPAVASAGRDAAATEIGGDQVQLERHGEGSVPAGPDVSAAFRGPYTCEGD